MLVLRANAIINMALRKRVVQCYSRNNAEENRKPFAILDGKVAATPKKERKWAYAHQAELMIKAQLQLKENFSMGNVVA